MSSKLKLDIHKLAGMTAQQEGIFLMKVVPLLEKTINSEEFKEAVYAYSWKKVIKKGPCYKRKYVEHNYLMFKGTRDTNAQVYTKFKDGGDKYNLIKDGDIDLYLTLYYSRKNVIGYTRPSTFKTWANRKYFNKWLESPEGRAKIIGNIIHEYMHNLGYGHAKYHNSTRKHTVPYAFGEIARTCALNIMR